MRRTGQKAASNCQVEDTPMGSERFYQQFEIGTDALLTDRETYMRCPAGDDENERPGHLDLRLADDWRPW